MGKEALDVLQGILYSISTILYSTLASKQALGKLCTNL